MGRVGFSYNDSREHFSSIDGLYDTNGNPTRTVNEPLVDGGQHARQPSGGAYLNAKWQFSANGMYQAWRGIEVAASIFGRQGLSVPDLSLRDARRRSITRRCGSSATCSTRSTPTPSSSASTTSA